MEKLRPCPFCGGKAKISRRQCGFKGWYGDGSKSIKYRIQVICNRCHARGKTITTEWMRDGLMKYFPKDFGKYEIQAVDGWNCRQEKQGEWLEVDEKHDAYDCSLCGAMVGIKCLYCPGCGARMKNGSRAYSSSTQNMR